MSWTCHPSDLAYPYPGVGNGLSKREHFAAMAMQAMATNGSFNSWADLADDAANLADALIERLNKPQPSPISIKEELERR